MTKGDKQEFVNLLHGHLSYENHWKKMMAEVAMPDMSGVESVRIYLEGTPVDSHFLIDDVSLKTSSNSWKDDANARIDQLRKRNLSILVNTPNGYDPSELKVEVEHTMQRFPFGTAIRAGLVRNCLDQGEDDLYCSLP